jgi:hypothetical protein
MARIDWNDVRNEWNNTPNTPFSEFCSVQGLPYSTAVRHYRKWVREAHNDLANVRDDLPGEIRNSQRTDIETADQLGRIIQNALNTIDPGDVKNLKELSSILNQLSSTRKNIFNYLPETKGGDVDWTRSLTITSDQDDSV